MGPNSEGDISPVPIDYESVPVQLESASSAAWPPGGLALASGLLQLPWCIGICVGYLVLYGVDDPPWHLSIFGTIACAMFVSLPASVGVLLGFRTFHRVTETMKQRLLGPVGAIFGLGWFCISIPYIWR